MRLVACMKAFDADCANPLTYTQIFEDHGISRDQLDQGVANMYQNLKSIHATYTRFDLGAPWPSFVARGKNYIFIPYNMVLKARGQNTSSKSFFIGVSVDSGGSWKFVDSQKVTQDNVSMIIPGYSGAKLPPVSLDQSASH
jgi:hypothetical protein